MRQARGKGQNDISQMEEAQDGVGIPPLDLTFPSSLFFPSCCLILLFHLSYCLTAHMYGHLLLARKGGGGGGGGGGKIAPSLSPSLPLSLSLSSRSISLYSHYSHSFSGFFSLPLSLSLVSSSLSLPIFHSLLFFFSGL